MVLSALYKAHFLQTCIPVDMPPPQNGTNIYLNKGVVLVLLRDESFIENKNTKYLGVMGKLDDGGFSQILSFRQ